MSAAPSAEQLVHDETVRAVERQRGFAAELRHAAGLLIATAAIAISLLDAEAFASPGSHPCAWLALTGFLVVSMSALAVIWPSRDAPLTPPAVSMLTAQHAQTMPQGDHAVRRHLLTQMELQQQLLARRNTGLSRAFRFGGFGLLMQLAATVAERILTT